MMSILKRVFDRSFFKIIREYLEILIIFNYRLILISGIVLGDGIGVVWYEYISVMLWYEKGRGG